jgi:formate dehydrogenase subunit gamma
MKSKLNNPLRVTFVVFVLALAALAIARLDFSGWHLTWDEAFNGGGNTHEFVKGPLNGADPTASAVREDLLLEELGKVTGRITIPDGRSATLVQPQGRSFQAFQQSLLLWVGGVCIGGMLCVLGLFYRIRGRITFAHSQSSGKKILRFTAVERSAHWMTAFSFVVLAISGLNLVFGRHLLMPLIGATAFATFSQYAKYAHDYLAWPFMAGVLLMAVLWLRDNIPDRTDLRWLKEGGGLVGQLHPPAYRFNAGQKMVFWSAMIFGIALGCTGLLLLFPFTVANITGMQTAQYVHGAIGVMFIAIIIAHIYIGTLGMEGAYDAMGTGEVDLAWAETHHSLWVEEMISKGEIDSRTEPERQMPGP